jgi:uncharacterized UBP type Zn finger protein
MKLCPHVDQIRMVEVESAGCPQCLAAGTAWVHLRVCLSCGQVGCCDSSTSKHASAHFAETGHPIAASLEAGEDWAWCYRDADVLEFS